MARAVYDYGSLQVAIQKWVSENSNLILESYETVLGLAENRIEGDLNLELYDQVTETLTASAGAKLLTKPDDWLTTRSLFVADDNGDFQPMYERADDFVTNLAASADAVPYAYYDVTVRQIAFAPPLDQDRTFRLKYKRRDTGLTTSTTQTWLSRNFPSLLLQACLIEAKQILKLKDTTTDPLNDYGIALQSAMRELSTLIDNDMLEATGNG